MTIILCVNITGIDLNLLIAFESLLDERHVGRAASRVGLSQPAFSNAISRLRVRLDDPLFVRTSQGMLPTPRAEQLGGPIRSALSLLRQTLEAPRSFDPNTSTQRFRIALSDDVEIRLAPLLSNAMKSSKLQLQTRRLDGIFVIPESELRTGALDLAVGYFPDARSLAPTFVMETLSEERNVVIARRGHPAFKKKLTLERFLKLDHAAVIYRNEPWGLIDNELATRGLRRRLRLALPHALSVLHAVSSSDLVACIQESAANRFGPELGLVSHPEPIGLPPFVLRMVWHRQRSDDPAQRWLRELIQRETASLPKNHARLQRKN
jgi:DNA-binding transcriptional LysR family regulator